MEKKIKLSEKQKEVIMKMRDGLALKQRSEDGTFILTQSNGMSERVASSTVHVLHKLDLIYLERKSFFAYSLTQLGHTIEL